MNWLSMIPPKERQEIVRELATRLSAEPVLASAFERVVESVLTRYGIKQRIRCEAQGLIPPDPVLTTAHGPIMDLISMARTVADNMHNYLSSPNSPGIRTNTLECNVHELRSQADAAEAALPHAKPIMKPGFRIDEIDGLQRPACTYVGCYRINGHLGSHKDNSGNKI